MGAGDGKVKARHRLNSDVYGPNPQMIRGQEIQRCGERPGGKVKAAVRVAFEYHELGLAFWRNVMGRSCRLVMATLFVAMAAGCGKPHDKALSSGARAVLEGADTIELMTLDPAHEDFDPKRAGTMQGYRILGTA